MAVQTPQNINLSAAIAELNSQSTARRINFDARRNTFVKHFRALSAPNRKTLCEAATEALKQRFDTGQTPDDVMLMMTTAIALERDWDAIGAFLESLLKRVTSSDSLQDVALSLLEIADNELTEDKSKLPVGQTALVMVTELGLLLANKAGGSALDFKGMARVVEYITSSLLARSNINDTAMRISLVHYLARCPLNNQATSQLNRVMGRFGQSLLHELFYAYFEDKKRGNAAFHFLVQYLDIFFVASPSLAQMAHDVLKHYMLKYPDQFPSFVSGYCELIPKEEIRLAAISRHIALLINDSVEVSKRSLAENLSVSLLQTIERFRDISVDALERQVSIARQIVEVASNKPSSASVVIEDFMMQADNLVARATNTPTAKVLPIGKAFKAKKARPVARIHRFGEEPSPLETMLALAS